MLQNALLMCACACVCVCVKLMFRHVKSARFLSRPSTHHYLLFQFPLIITVITYWHITIILSEDAYRTNILTTAIIISGYRGRFHHRRHCRYCMMVS